MTRQSFIMVAAMFAYGCGDATIVEIPSHGRSAAEITGSHRQASAEVSRVAPSAAGPEASACDAPRACGPEVLTPNRICADGSTAGPTGRCVASSDDDGCRWEITTCPEDSP